jgi:hypothetical protein
MQMVEWSWSLCQATWQPQHTDIVMMLLLSSILGEENILVSETQRFRSLVRLIGSLDLPEGGWMDGCDRCSRLLYVRRHDATMKRERSSCCSVWRRSKICHRVLWNERSRMGRILRNGFTLVVLQSPMWTQRAPYGVSPSTSTHQEMGAGRQLRSWGQAV